ncbi:MAG TPA: cytochrome c biogenesis protein CcsA [Acidimicrobiia bacterium]|nr:cytochrome c biogenesis protein CcsA [Acidimicrobiia bacterium]
MTRTLPRAVLGALAVVGVAAGLWLALTSSPDVFQGDYVRIMYVHVPGSWLAFLAFGVTALGSLGWLVTKRMVFDRVAEASAEIGVLFTAVSLFTGMLWGYPVWGTFWDWGDPRMASTALMFFVYLGYLALRRSIADPVGRARRSAILGVVAVVQVPLVYFSVTLWRSLHQGMTVRPDGIAMDGSMVAALLVNLAAFTVLYLYLMILRTSLAVQEAEAVATETEQAGRTVAKPNLEGLS